MLYLRVYFLGMPALALSNYGNAIGSVICNTALSAAITVAVRPGNVDPKPLRVPVAFFFAAAAIYCVAAYGMGRFTRSGTATTPTLGSMVQKG